MIRLNSDTSVSTDYEGAVKAYSLKMVIVIVFTITTKQAFFKLFLCIQYLGYDKSDTGQVHGAMTYPEIRGTDTQISF